MDSSPPRALRDLTPREHRILSSNLIHIGWLLKRWSFGAILLTSNPQGLGKPIRFFQRIGQGDPAYYGHTAILSKTPGTIYESVLRIQQSQIDKYIGQKILVFQHVLMDFKAYAKGIAAIKDNMGAVYPGHRLLIHGIEAGYKWLVRTLTFKKYRPRLSFTQWLPLDWPVCSELAAQFCLGTGLNYPLPKMGLQQQQTWKGINPDHFHDMLLRYGPFTKICEGTLIDDNTVVDIDRVVVDSGVPETGDPAAVHRA